MKRTRRPTELSHRFQGDSVSRTLALIGDHWTLMILREELFGVRRFGQLARNLGIPRPTLSARLRSMVDSGLLERVLYARDPERYEYRLTDAGRELFGDHDRSALTHSGEPEYPGVVDELTRALRGCVWVLREYVTEICEDVIDGFTRCGAEHCNIAALLIRGINQECDNSTAYLPVRDSQALGATVYRYGTAKWCSGS